VEPHLPDEIKILIALAMIALNGFFVGGELAIVRARQSRLTELADSGHRLAAETLAVVRRLDVYLAVSQLGITIASLVLGWLGEPAVAAVIATPLERIGLSPAAVSFLSLGIAFVGIIFLQIVLGELVPKSIAIMAPERTAMFVAGPFRFFGALARPFIAVLNASSRAVLHLFGQELVSATERAHSGAELQLLLAASEAGGILDPVEQDLASNALELGDVRLHELMIPRVAIRALSDDLDLPAARAATLASDHDWLPVFHESIDSITGLIDWHDLFRKESRPWPARARPVLLLPESMPVSDALERLRENGAEMAIAMDEHGGTAGLVTVRTLYEEVTRRITPGGFVAGSLSGLVPIRTVESLLEIEIADNEANTVGGYLTQRLGRFGHPGDRLVVAGWQFTIERMRAGQTGVIDAVMIERIREESPAQVDSSRSDRG
jgi:CBS domain containing-hemolysin-like protein